MQNLLQYCTRVTISFHVFHFSFTNLLFFIFSSFFSLLFFIFFQFASGTSGMWGRALQSCVYWTAAVRRELQDCILIGWSLLRTAEQHWGCGFSSYVALWILKYKTQTEESRVLKNKGNRYQYISLMFWRQGFKSQATLNQKKKKWLYNNFEYVNLLLVISDF